MFSSLAISKILLMKTRYVAPWSMHVVSTTKFRVKSIELISKCARLLIAIGWPSGKSPGSLSKLGDSSWRHHGSCQYPETTGVPTRAARVGWWMRQDQVTPVALIIRSLLLAVL